MNTLKKPIRTQGATMIASNSQSNVTKMKVYIRIRPPNEREQTAEYRNIVKQVDDQMLIFDPKENDEPFFFRGLKQKMRDITKKQNKEMQFVFDRVYGSADSNDDVFNGSICNILPSLLEGYNCSVFVYGATGAGKTYTMLGNENAPGIIYLTMRSLYLKIGEIENKHFDIGISFLEIYQEEVYDLLNPSSGKLHLREDNVNGVIVAGIKIMQINDVEHLFELLRQGNANRTQHPTEANAVSSRSHAVFQVFLKIQEKNCEKVQLVKLSMIDLAGSERGAATNCKGLRFKEGASINKSLLALGNCINSLADGVSYIPYRSSRLTRLLKDSLGGNCQTAMVACVGPTVLSYEDTYNTLKYAARASTIKTKFTKNVLSVDSHISHYKVMLQDMQAKVTSLEQEVEQWKQTALLPKTRGDLSTWIEKVEVLFSGKKSIHQEILTLESKEKLLKWRINHKLNNAEHISVYEDSEDEEFNRLGESATRMAGTVNGLQNRLSELWSHKIDNDEEIDALRNDIEKNGLTDAISAEIMKHEAAIAKAESSIQISHLSKMLNLIDVRNEIQRNIITKMAEQNSQYYNLLLGYNKVTASMTGEHKDLKNLLKGNHSISWAISPKCKVKKRADILASYAKLSVDALYADLKLCPFMAMETEEKEVIEGETVLPSKMSSDTTFVIPPTVSIAVPIPQTAPMIPVTNLKRKLNETFTRPIKSPRRIGRVMPLGGAKTVSMKENVKSFTINTGRISFPHPRKTDSGIKFRKTPLATKNENM